MCPASETPGKPEKKAGSDSPKTRPGTKPAERADADRAGKDKTKPPAEAAKSVPATAAANSSFGAERKSGELSETDAQSASGKADDTDPYADTSGGGAGPGSPPTSDRRRFWSNLVLPALSAVIGGLIVAAGFRFTDMAGLLPGGAGPLAVEHRVEALEGRVEALADLSGGEPLVRQVSDMSASVKRLQSLMEGLESGTTGEGAPTGLNGQEMRSQVEQMGEELVRLDTRLAQLSGEITRTEARLDGRVASLEILTPDDLPQLLDKTADKETVETLTSRVTRLEKDESGRDVRQAARALALANLTRAVETSQPFEDELHVMEVMEPGNADVTALKPYAESGLPSVPTLAGRFDKVADDVVRAHRRAHGKGVLGTLWDHLVGLFRVRPVGELEGKEAPALVARTEQRLQDGDLYLAVEEMSKLGEPENQAATDWLEAARARVHLDQLVSSLNRTVLEDIEAKEAARRMRRETAPPEPESAAPDADTAPRAATPEPGGEDEPETENEAPDASEG